MIGEDSAKEFFYVDSDTCRVTVKKMLYPGTATDYTVSYLHVHVPICLTQDTRNFILHRFVYRNISSIELVSDTSNQKSGVNCDSTPD